MTNSKLQAAKQQMLGDHLRKRGIHDQGVLAAMDRVPRERFVCSRDRHQAYADRALPIESGQTISQPYIVALMTQAAELSGSETVLEIGTGSGYQTAILAELTEQVVSIERHHRLSTSAGSLLVDLGYRNVILAVGDGTLGWPDYAPYDRIIVTATAEKCPPPLFGQLAEGGVIVIPLGTAEQQVLQTIRKVSGKPQSADLSRCRFVPLVGKQGWSE